MRYLFVISFLLLIGCDSSTGPDSDLFNYWNLESVYTISPTYGAINQTPDVGHILYVSKDSLCTYVAYGTDWNGGVISEGWFDSTKVTVDLITCTEDEILSTSDNDKMYNYSISGGKLKLSASVQLYNAALKKTETGTVEQTYVSYSGLVPPEDWPPLKVGE